MREVRDHVLDMVQMADRAGFEIAWAAEHHALEMTIAPNPFQIMTWWADHTEEHPSGMWRGQCRLLAPDQSGG